MGTDPIIFQSTPLMRGETKKRHMRRAGKLDFNPLPSCEGRRIGTPTIAVTSAFQSTPLMRGETEAVESIAAGLLNFNPLPSCEGRLQDSRRVFHVPMISIHSPHARGDCIIFSSVRVVAISIHSPHARGDTGGRSRRKV